MTTVTARSYCPRTGSVPAQVIAYFQKNLSAKLTNAEMAVKFACDAKNVSNFLQLAIEANFIVRSNGYYTAGDDIDQAPDYGSAAQADATIAAAATKGGAHSPFAHSYQPSTPTSQAKAPKPASQPPQVKAARPGPASLLIEDDVPLPAGRGSTYVDWKTTLLDRMKAGQSVALPMTLKSTLAKFIAQEHKSSDKTFVTRITSSVQFRIWRTA